MTDALLSIRGLTVQVPAGTRCASIVQGVDFDLDPGGSVGLVGESGSGKTTTLRAVLRLLPLGARITSGRVLFDGLDLAEASTQELRTIRGGRIGVIWQDPLAALDPVMPVGDQIAEAIRAHVPVSKEAARARAKELMRLVELPDVERTLHAYAHELSGGQRQRVIIAGAIAAEPLLLLADEPTTALDVTVQDQVLSLLARLRGELGLALLLVTHDLGVVAESCEHVAVMYAGRIVETGTVADVFAAPRHPYTAGLLRAAPSIDRPGSRPTGIPGTPASAVCETGCAFATRCHRADDECANVTPVLDGNDSRRVACHHPLSKPRGSDPAANRG